MLTAPVRSETACSGPGPSKPPRAAGPGPEARLPLVQRARLRPPRLPDNVLPRPRLLAELDRGQVLTLIVAPAGYGKTTLAATWAAQHERPVAWLTLDRSDDSLPHFLAGLTAAVRRVYPRFDPGADRLAEAGATPAQVRERVLPPLLNALDALEPELALVLDDYHHVTDPGIHELLWGLLAHPPHALHLVLTARHDPPLPPRLRFQGAVTELRAAALRFTAAETGALLALFGVAPAQSPALTAYLAQAEGWASPLRLAAVHLSQAVIPGVVSGAVTGVGDAVSADTLRRCTRFVLEFLDQDVVGQLPADLQAFLALTAVLPQFNAALCAAVIGAALPGLDSAAALERLAAGGVMLEYLDAEGAWFRYHALLRALLQRRLHAACTPEQVAALEARAATWWQEQAEAPALAARLARLTAVQEQPPAAMQPALTPPAASAGTPGGAPPVIATGSPARDPARHLAELLTFREMDVLQLIRQRLTNKEIAAELGIALETVKQHSANIYHKLGVHGRREAIVRADAYGAHDNLAAAGNTRLVIAAPPRPAASPAYPAGRSGPPGRSAAG